MASTKSYLEYVLDLLSGLDGISYRAMMDEQFPDGMFRFEKRIKV